MIPQQEEISIAFQLQLHFIYVVFERDISVSYLF